MAVTKKLAFFSTAFAFTLMVTGLICPSLSFADENALSDAKVLVKPGQAISVQMATEDLVPTDDVDLATRQVEAYPDSPEASFILAVALTRTSRVEDALREVRRARKLAEKQGGASYFDKMIASYEGMLEYYPDDNRVRYGLAWAYYMKAYLLAKKAPMAQQQLAEAAKAGAPSTVPQVKQYYEAALKNLDDLLARKPDDVWARVYRAHLHAEYTGDLAQSMQVWKQCREANPDNPAPYFFLGEGYLKEGNLKESVMNISRAIALRGIGH